MSTSKDDQIVRINLTPSQAQEIKSLTGREVEALQMSVQELEQRIVPTVGTTSGGLVNTMLAANSNETLLAS